MSGRGSHLLIEASELDFGDFEGRVWLDTAHQGAMPTVAARALLDAVRWKSAPQHLTFEKFLSVPACLRRVVARLLNASADDVVLSNSASYGIHTVAQAFPWRDGDEVLVTDGDFPSNILPWKELASRSGVTVRMIRPESHVVRPDELLDALTESTRLFCLSSVHSFSGYTADLMGLGAICRAHSVATVVNASQGLGAAPLDVSSTPIDALVSIGSKWLCGPYGTGVFWIHPDLRHRLSGTKSYWLSEQNPLSLEGSGDDPASGGGPETGTFDIFGTANFFNFVPFLASLEYLLEVGVKRVAEHDQALVGDLIEGLPSSFELLSPADPGERSTLVLLSHRDRARNASVVAELARRGVSVSLRRGLIRVSPHLYNTPDDINRVLELLTVLGA